MHGAQNSKVEFFTPPGAIVDNTAYVCNVIDTKGYDYVEIYFQIGATDIAMAALKVQESDVKSNTTALTSGVDIAGTVFGTATGISGSVSALPSSTADNTVVKCEINMLGRKRYLLPVATAGDGSAGTYLNGVAILSRAETGGVSASDRGLGEVLRT